MPTSDSIESQVRVELIDRSERGDDRHRLVRLVLGEQSVIVKIYGRKRGRLRTFLRELGHGLLTGKSSVGARARCETERRVLELWRRHGFAVPAIVELDLSSLLPDPFLVMEFVAGPTLRGKLDEPELSRDRKRALVRRYAGAMGRRHRKAIELGEPELVQVHAGGRHVFERGGQFVHVDFEVVARSDRDLERLVSLEIMGLLTSIGWPPEDRWRWVVEAFAEGYPDPGQLRRLRADLSVGRSPHLALLVALGRRMRRDPREQQLLERLEQLVAATV